MKKILFGIFLIIFFLAVGFFLFKNKVGDIRPAVLPVKPLPTNNTNITPANLPLKLPSQYTLGLFAENTGNGRDLEFSPGQTLLVSITSEGEIKALPDKNQDGRADSVKTVLTGLKNPHGIAFYNGKLYVAEETKISRYNWNEQNLEAVFDKTLFNIPQGGRHFSRSLAFDSKGNLYVTVGSTCDVCRENHPWLSAVIVSDAQGNNPRLFASGLRNSVFIAVNPETNELWGTEMGRDFLGDNAPPDEINIIKDGENYGWPNCYGDKIPDANFNQNANCSNTEPPVYRIQAHSAPLGLVFINSPQFPADWQGDLLVAYHGSWNRSSPVGYKIVRMNVEGNQVLEEEDFISGFLEESQVIGRPVDLVFDKKGNLYISDDKSGAVYIVTIK
ncbi:MAG: PQQ-dependent sugar dehydrogenase [Candidatus Roizmanbacteria bacterium]|nr:MAG: PQQ-dependent sugar dehydrogenase [Candidatus Roizmanbacteria bacterium]